MELTQKQELYISRYMRAVADALADNLSDKQCERALSRLQARIRDNIRSSASGIVDDAHVLEVLRRMGPPQTQATILARVWGNPETPPSPAPEPAVPAQTVQGRADDPQPEPEPAQKTEDAEVPEYADPAVDAVWLGVCACLSRRLGLPLLAVRLLAVLAGLFTGPFALLAYVGLFFKLRMDGGISLTAPLRPGRMLWRPATTSAATIAIHLLGVYVLRGLYLAHQMYMKRPLATPGEWAWFETEGGRLLLIALACIAPVALLSATPLKNGWDYSLHRLSQAGVALYAILVSFGVASFITGVILSFVTEFTG